VTTQSADGGINVAPMGPIVDAGMTTLVLRPFQTSTTYTKLKLRGEGVLHVTDDVPLLARAATRALAEPPALFPPEQVEGAVLRSTCRWYEFRVIQLDDSQERTRIVAEVVHAGRLRDFFGFNRAKHAVLEGAILATRIHLLPAAQIRAEFERLAVPVEKTAGEAEQAAFALLREYVERQIG